MDSSKSFYAHVRSNGEKQVLSEHLLNVANQTKTILDCLGIGSIGFLTGLLHDMGKYSDAFQEYLSDASEGKSVVKGSVNHSRAGLIFVFSRLNPNETNERILAELIGFAVASHHGLIDCYETNGNNGFLDRLGKEKALEVDYSEVEKRFCEQIGEDCLREAFDSAKREVPTIIESIHFFKKNTDCRRSKNESNQTNFFAGFIAKSLLSALIESDRSDAAMFDGVVNERKCASSFSEIHAYFEEKIDSFPTHSKIDALRSKWSKLCLDAGGSDEKKSGVFRLNFPTGGGKTLSSFRFALRNASRFSKQRIFYVAPLLSITDQNVRCLKDVLGPKYGAVILEHTSDVVKEDMNSDTLAAYELMAETWHAPIVVTTMVQFLNTLFSGKTTCIRRFHSLENSVIIIDEIQNLPIKVTNMFNSALNCLSYFFNCTILACSATQPKPPDMNGYVPIVDKGPLIDMRMDELDVFRRVSVIPPGDDLMAQGLSVAEVSERLFSLSAKHQSVLCVCNTKKMAALLYSELSKSVGDRISLFFLSAGMCKEHRKDILGALETSLKDNGLKVICVSTQVIEAGVDISFGCVVRSLAGLDNIAQAAGRCNRNGEFGRSCPVYIFKMKDESVAALPEIANAQFATLCLLKNRTAQLDLMSADLFGYYYYNYFKECGEQQLGYVIKGSERMFDLLGENKFAQSVSVFLRKAENKNLLLKQSFRTAGDAFTVFDQESKEVIIPYHKKGEELISNLCCERAKWDVAFVKEQLEVSKRFVVSVPTFTYNKINENGGIKEVVVLEKVGLEQPVSVLLPNFYDETGVLSNDERFRGGF